MADPGPWEIRPYRPADREAVLRLWQACELTRPWNDPLRDIALCSSGAAGVLLVAAARPGPGLLATVMAGSDGHRGWMYYLAVDPGAGRRGLGRAMVRHAERWLAARGIRKVNLMIRDENSHARAFYERLGYAAEARICMGRWLDREP